MVEHTQDVLDASEGLFGTEDNPSRLCREWCRFFHVEDVESFVRHLRIACCLHDLGKSNSGFQGAVTGKATSQSVRHKHLSALLINRPALRDQLFASGCDVDVVNSAVPGHHLQASYKTLGRCLDADIQTFKILGEGVEGVLALTARACQLEEFSAENHAENEVWSYEGGGVDATNAANTLRNHFKTFRRKLKDETNRPLRSLTIAVRAALIVADAAGSGFVRTSTPEERNAVIRNQLEKCFQLEPFDGAAIHRKVIQPRLDELNAKFVHANRPEFRWHDFQEHTAKLGPRSLLLAGCGAVFPPRLSDLLYFRRLEAISEAVHFSM